MAYISFRHVRVAPRNARWAFGASITSVAALVTSLMLDRLTSQSGLASFLFQSAVCLSVLIPLIAIPGMIVPFAVLLAPFGTAVYSAIHDGRVWLAAWYWGFTAACALLGGWSLVWFGKQYDLREHPDCVPAGIRPLKRPRSP